MFNTIKVFDEAGNEEIYTWDGDKYFEAAQRIQTFIETFEILREDNKELPGKNYIAFLMVNYVIIVPLDKQNPEDEVIITKKDIGYQIASSNKEKLQDLFNWLRENGVKF